jgi:hypothetical protein
MKTSSFLLEKACLLADREFLGGDSHKNLSIFQKQLRQE